MESVGGIMINKFEQAFVTNCIVKRMQDRLLFELSGKKRMNGIDRFSHNADEVLKAETIIAKSNQLSMDEILAVSDHISPETECYIAAHNENLDRRTCSFSEAAELVLGNGMPAIIIAEHFALIETEQCYGTPTRYIVRF